MTSSSLLADLETCQRKGFYSRFWQLQRLSPTQMVTRAVYAALCQQDAKEPGEYAGSEVLQLAEDRGLETEYSGLYSQVIHLAALSDILVSAVRKSDEPAWLTPPPVGGWQSGCLLSPDGSHLRRIALVSNWSDERHYSECRNWATMGEISAYGLPMQIAVFVIGQQRNGKRHSPWTQGFLHPMNKMLRFRKRSKGFRSVGNPFNERWEKISREDHAEITREKWLESMLRDDVLRDVCFKVDVPVPAERPLQRIRDMKSRKLERLYEMTEKPDANLTNCDWPVPCVFRKCCHNLPEREPSTKNGFILLRAGDAVV